MLDPSIMDLMHHMGRQPPPIVRPLVTSAAPSVAETERHIRTVENWADEWIRTGQQHFAEFKADYTPDEDNSADIPALDRAIEIAERSVAENEKVYKFQVKTTRKLVSSIKSALPLEVNRYKAERKRMLAAFARVNLARVELLYGLRALRAECDPNFNSGPTFNAGDDLAAYLTAAVA